MTTLNADEVMRRERDALGREGAEPSLSALCISGGGIRSATFGLGVLQGLAERGLLQQFDYLSTVSGGGFIGGFLTTWIKRAGFERASARLAQSTPAAVEATRDPIQHLREYNSYLSPTTGAMSADLWTLLAGALRNIILNWLVLIPVLLAALMVPRLYLSLLSVPERFRDGVMFSANGKPNYGTPELDAISNSWIVSWVLPGCSLLLFALVLLNTLRYLPGVGGRRHSRADYQRAILYPSVGAVLAFLAFDSLYYVGHRYAPYSHFWSVVLWTMIPCVVAWLLFLITDRKALAQRLHPFRGPLPAAILAMATGTGTVTWAIVNFILPQVSWPVYVTAGPPAVLLGFSLGTMIFTGLSSGVLRDDDREWLSRSSAGILLACMLWAAAAGMVLLAPALVLHWRGAGTGIVGAGGAISALLSRIPAEDAPNSNSASQAKPKPTAVALVLKAAPVVFITLLAVSLSIFTNALLVGVRSLVEVLAHFVKGIALLPAGMKQPLLDATRLTGDHGQRLGFCDHVELLSATSPSALVVLTVVFLATAWVMARYVDINTFSLHGMYRDRLVRAYLGASNQTRQPNPFTDFDVKDDAHLAELVNVRPFHIINTTLNLVHTNRLAWQERKAASFTMTPLHCGSAEVGYRNSESYAGGISLGTAVAISGAAASPNMGYYSSPLVGFIMTLFNARLGFWLGNPGAAGEQTWKETGPRSALRALLAEAAGDTSSNSEYVYLSDGGHFENLGLYEVVRRRCLSVVVVDSGCDPSLQLGDLGNALRKIRIDFGVPIEFSRTQLRALTERKARHAVASIRYSQVDPAARDGLLLYLKPSLLGNESPDVESYAAAHPDFPHQSTADQAFDESQTESYRELGVRSVRDLCIDWRGIKLDELLAELQRADQPQSA